MVKHEDRKHLFSVCWPAGQSVDTLLARVDPIEADMQSMEVDAVCQHWQHSNDFYAEVLHRGMDTLLGQRTPVVCFQNPPDTH